MNRVIIIGGGAAGCMAAYMAAGCGAQAVLLESTPRLMNKVRITGKGRCNLTNAVVLRHFWRISYTTPDFSEALLLDMTTNGLWNCLKPWVYR